MSLEEISPTNSDDAADNFLTRQFERQNSKDFLNERQQQLTLRKSPNPHIPLSVSAAPAEAELTVPKTKNEIINDAGDIAASNPSNPSNDEPHLHECRDLNATQLRKKYKHEYESWKNHKPRMKERGLDVHPQFEKFCDFLACMGPCKGGTLDRITPSDPEYAPGKVRWADKRTPSANRRNVHLIQTPDGPKTVPQIAQLQKKVEVHDPYAPEKQVDRRRNLGPKAIGTDTNYARPDFNFDPAHRRRQQGPLDLPAQARP